MPNSLHRLPLAAAAGLALLATGCASHRDRDTFAEAVSAGERPVAMRGQSNYFDGQIQATVTVSRGVGQGRAPSARGGAGGWRQDTSGMDDDQQMAYIRARAAIGSPLPPVTLRLKLQNLGTKVVQVDIQEVNSDLGNFAVDPELLSLAPNQTAEPYPMISQLGVTSDVIPVKVTLSMNGKTESQMIEVRNLKSTDQAPLPPSASSGP